MEITNESVNVENRNYKDHTNQARTKNPLRIYLLIPAVLWKVWGKAGRPCCRLYLWEPAQKHGDYVLDAYKFWGLLGSAE
jgi:hypothetical protein